MAQTHEDPQERLAGNFKENPKGATKALKRLSPKFASYVKVKVGELLEGVESCLSNQENPMDALIKEVNENLVYDKKSGEERIWDFLGQATEDLYQNGPASYSKLIGEAVKYAPKFKEEIRKAAGYELANYMVEKGFTPNQATQVWKTYTKETGSTAKMAEAVKKVKEHLHYNRDFDDTLLEAESRYVQGVS